MNTKIIGISILSLFFLFSCKQQTIELKVRLEAQYNSIEAAFEKAKEIKFENESAKISIVISPGTYYLQAPLEITPELNGLSLIGESVSTVKIKGSKPLKLDWQKSEANIYKAIVPEGSDFDQLIIDGNPQILARYPNYNEDGGYWQGYAADALSKERVASWKKPEGAYFHV
jgi:hypothetical protein